MQSSNKKTVNKAKQKQVTLLEEAQKLQQNIKKKKANIQKKYNKSVVNQLYIFPRTLHSNIQSQSSSSQQEIQVIYNLKSQNVKSKNNQTKSILNTIDEGVRTKQYYSVKSNHSIHSVEQGGKTLKNKSRKSKNIEISFNTKKKTPSQTKNNSQRKLFADQYSLQNRVYATTKQNNNRLVVSFRGNKKHQINISLSGRRMKTQIN